LWSFVIDQLLHLGILATISSIYETTKELPLQMIDSPSSFSTPLLILAVLLCMKPANILIKLILEKYQVGESESCDNIKNAGALIGNLERILTIVFVLLGQFEAIVAAKSILRFKDTDTAKTEYVLAGTFLSFGIAILCGLMARI
jgi:multisubunit Na+/H+ antiporter MnhG subunit